jgi:DNA-binding transcriptional regulator YhcF (GntR family)
LTVADDGAIARLVALDESSGVPPFEQVRGRLAAAIETGALPAGTKLPTVRRLATDLGLAVNTVARSYRELEMANLIETRGRNGTFVAGDATRTGRLASRAARDFVRRMREFGLGDREILAVLRRELDHRPE